LTLSSATCLFFAGVAPAHADEPVGIHAGHGGAADYPAQNYDSLWTVATPLADSKEGQALLAGCLDALGGSEHLKKLTAFKAVWAMSPSGSRDSVLVTRTVAPERRHRIDIAKADHSEIRILNRQQAWHLRDNQVVPLDGMRYKAELFSDYTLRLPLSMLDSEFTGMRRLVRPNDSLDCIFLDLPDSLWLVIGIDPQDHLIRRVEGVIRQDDRRMIFVNLLSDYGEYSGYLFPRKLTNIAMGLKVGEAHLVSLKVNPEIEDDDFRPPVFLKETH